MMRVERWARFVAGGENRLTWGGTAGLSLTTIPVLAGLTNGLPTVPPSLHPLYVAAVVLTGWAIFHLAVVLLASLFALFRLPIPRLFAACVFCFCTVTFVGWSSSAITDAGAAAVTAIYAVIALGAGTAGSVLAVGPRGPAAVLYAIPAALAAVSAAMWLYGPGAHTFPPSGQPASEAIVAVNPGLPGEYRVRSFTYGSGDDRHRPEFASGAELVSPAVDASGFLTDWGRARTRFWGFGPEALPLNGRVWMPEGEGPFPLAIIVHGNHNMEYFSDEGYAYLGELLASRGIVTVSVDQNFINYSAWSGEVAPDMTIRAWLLLQHLQWIAAMNGAPDNAFAGRVDLDSVALMGHSRGGQAAALAASFGPFFRDAANIPLPNEDLYRIRSVVSIAPIDRAIDKRYVSLRNVNYLVLQGAMDGDVNVFYGHRQYSRIRWNDGEPYFKSALYIQGANHGQFNTAWGDADIASPLHLLLNRKDLLSGDEQRDIARVFIAAFLETTLKGNDAYFPMFQDYRLANEWLPQTTYLQQYEDSLFVPINRYSEDDDKETAAIRGARIEASGMSQWVERPLEDRERDSLFNDAVYLAWDGRREAVYELDFTDVDYSPEAIGATSKFGFDLANADLDVTRRDKEPPDVWLEFETVSGRKVRFDLQQFQPVPKVIHTRFTKSVFFEDALRNGNLGHSAEATLQTFLIPLSEVLDESFRAEKLARMRFLFPAGASGKIILDNIGLYPADILSAETVAVASRR